jgi:hypothetical protein
MKYILFFSLTLLFSKQLSSQNYNPIFKTKNTNWKAYFSSFSGEGMTYYSSMKDTIINSKKYRIINEENNLYGYLREDSTNRKLYSYSTFAGEQLLYDFNLVKGDTFLIYLMGRNSSWSWVKFNVDTIYNSNILGGSRKTIELSSQYISFKFKWIESIGSVHINENNLDYAVILYNKVTRFVDWPGYKLICKMDDNITKYENIYNTIGHNYSCNGDLDTCKKNINDSIYILKNAIYTFETNNIHIDWIYCDSNNTWKGDTGIVFIPKKDGNYSAYISKNGCYKISKCIDFKSKSSINELHDSKIEIHPNPTNDRLYLKQSGLNKIDFDIYDLVGKKQLTGQTRENIDVSMMSEGLYLLHISTRDGNMVHKFEVKR